MTGNQRLADNDLPEKNIRGSQQRLADNDLPEKQRFISEVSG